MKIRKMNINGASWDSVFLTIVKLVTTLTAILQTKILSVGLSLTAYGTYSQANVVVSVCTSILLLGLGDAINFFYNDERHPREKRVNSVNTIYAIELIAGIILSIVVVSTRGLFAVYFSNDALKIVLTVVALKPMLDNLIYFYQVLFVSVGKAKVIAVRNFVISLLKLAATAVAVLFFNSVIAIFISFILLDLLQLIFFVTFFAKDEFVVLPHKADIKIVKDIIGYALPIGIFALTNTMVRDIDKFVVGYLSDTETVAIYSNCSKILPFDIVAISFATVLIPYIMKYISRNDRSNAIVLFKNYLKIGYYSVWILGIAVLIVNQQAISFLYSSEYLLGKDVFIIYIIDSMLKFASMHLILTASGKVKLLMLYSALSLALNTVLNIVLFNLMGIVGPAIATLAVTALYTLLILRKSIITLGTKWTEVFDLSDITTFVLGLVTTAIVFCGLNHAILKIGVNQYITMMLVMSGYGIVNLLIYRKRIKFVLQLVNNLKM